MTTDTTIPAHRLQRSDVAPRQHAAKARLAQFPPDELAQVAFAIAAIDTWNRRCVSTRLEPGHHVPGMFAA
jgi:hypothetical protein